MPDIPDAAIAACLRSLGIFVFCAFLMWLLDRRAAAERGRESRRLHRVHREFCAHEALRYQQMQCHGRRSPIADAYRAHLAELAGDIESTGR